MIVLYSIHFNGEAIIALKDLTSNLLMIAQLVQPHKVSGVKQIRKAQSFVSVYLLIGPKSMTFPAFNG